MSHTCLCVRQKWIFVRVHTRKRKKRARGRESECVWPKLVSKVQWFREGVSESVDSRIPKGFPRRLLSPPSLDLLVRGLLSYIRIGLPEWPTWRQFWPMSRTWWLWKSRNVLPRHERAKKSFCPIPGLCFSSVEFLAVVVCCSAWCDDSDSDDDGWYSGREESRGECGGGRECTNNKNVVEQLSVVYNITRKVE